jgi:hypothetical protein
MAKHARIDPNIIAAEIDSRIPIRSPLRAFPSMSSAPAISIVKDLEAALCQLAAMATDLKR